MRKSFINTLFIVFRYIFFQYSSYCISPTQEKKMKMKMKQWSFKEFFFTFIKMFIIYSKIKFWDMFNTKRNFEESEACRLLPSSCHWAILLQTNFSSDKIPVQLKEQLFVHTFKAANMTYLEDLSPVLGSAPREMFSWLLQSLFQQ